MAYTENTAGIIAAINACILAQGGTVTSYPSNTGGVIQALIALEAAITAGGGGGGGGSGSAVSIPFTAGEALIRGDAVYLSIADGKVYRAKKDGTREQATVIGFATANKDLDDDVNVIVRGQSYGREIGWSRVSLLCNFDSNNFDTSEVGHASPTNNGVTDATIDLSNSKFGIGSARFDGTAELDWVTDSSLDLDGDFTIEFWLYLDALPGVGGMSPISKRNSVFTEAGTWQIHVQPGPSGDIEWWECHGSMTGYSFGQVTAATWHHVAISRTDSTLSMYFDGVSGGSHEDTTDYTSIRPLRLGATDLQNGLVGNIDELRITKGVGRYTGAFTPPAAPFTAGTEFTVGTEYFLDSLTGHITSVPASTSGDYLTAIGEAISTTQLDAHLQTPVQRT